MAIISGAEPLQAELGWGEVIDARLKVGEVGRNQIELDFVERSGAGRRAEIDFAARIFSLPGDAGGKVEELSDSLQVRRGVGMGDGLGWNAAGNRRKGGHSSLAHLGGQARRF